MPSRPKGTETKYLRGPAPTGSACILTSLNKLKAHIREVHIVELVKDLGANAEAYASWANRPVAGTSQSIVRIRPQFR